MSKSLLDRGRGLFEFLRAAQRLKTVPVRTLDAYVRDGAVLWLADLPVHEAVHVCRDDSPAFGEPVFSVGRVVKVEPPEPGGDLERWLASCDDPGKAPALRSRIDRPGPARSGVDDEEVAGGDESFLWLKDFPDIQAQFDAWLPRWRTWAAKERIDRPARELYNELYSVYLSTTENPESFELVIGVGCLAWRPALDAPVKRHLLTSPAAVHFNDSTGLLQVRPVESAEALRVELDMVDPGRISAPDKVNEVREDVKRFEGHPLSRAPLGDLLRRLVHNMDSDGEYRDEDGKPEAEPHLVTSFAPAVILRKRSQHGLSEIFDTILAQLDESGQVPDGLIPLLDPDHVPSAPGPSNGGAIVEVDDDPFLPMPVNDKQLAVIRRVDRQAQTLVQGPPGTGKTHTAAALISHLLAQGKRVLVTAHTDRALREVRDKLPDAIKPLSVAVVGSSREDMADLKTAVQEIATAANEHDDAENARQIQRHLGTIDRLRRERSALYSQLLEAREREVRDHECHEYRGTLSSIAQRLDAEADRHHWLLDYDAIPASSTAPLSGEEALEWLGYLLDAGLAADAAEARLRLFQLSSVPEPDQFARIVAAERGAVDTDGRYAPLKDHAAFEAVLNLAPERRAQLRQRLHALADEADQLAGRQEQWMNDALRDVRSGRAGQWWTRAQSLQSLIDACTPAVDRVGLLHRVEMRVADSGSLVALAREVLTFVAGGGTIKTAADGSPKVGAFAPKVLKQAQPLFETVRVDGLAPVTADQLEVFLAWAEASKALTALDQAWPSTVDIPDEDTLQERLQWHITEFGQLRRVLALADKLGDEDGRFREAELPPPDWNDLDAVRAYASLTDAVAAQEALRSAVEPLVALDEFIAMIAQWEDAAPCVTRMLDAVRHRDHENYAIGYQRLARLWQVRASLRRRDELGDRLAEAAPVLRQAISTQPGDDAWPGKLSGLAAAWAWASTRSWVLGLESVDVNAVQAQVSAIEQNIRQEVEAVAARRAWDYAASPQRLGRLARADLTQYAQLVQSAGKNTGVYRNERRAEIRRAMDRCRPSVPVWIMPIYRIAEQLRVQPDMFDVIIVDEASQAGTEAVFLQYMAPKIVVVGDDKQVSPSAVGVDQQQLRDLARQYLSHDRFRDSWQNPKRSLFDEAKMRYGDLITLTEHRRCVPEIIKFSNRIAYEPDGIRLVPVRQYGVDRLDPVKAVYLEDGYERGVTNKVNPVEAEAIVEQIEKCLADPAYDGETFGVISLLGPSQAKHIQNLALSRIPKEEWRSRDLRCGDAADFQGSERDVVFLSMVSAPTPDRRMTSLTGDQYVQRFNVAVSRAKDQVWVFHSVQLGELQNPECMRFQLLDYCYGVLNRGHAADDRFAGEQVPDDRRVEPFDSLFEQRVYNRIVDRGFTVFPQYEEQGYLIDLVVMGGRTKLAVECDGDAWHGPDVYERDLARQRDLERCGWRFFRIPGSAFDLDPAEALSGLWEMLREEDITAADRGEPVQVEAREVIRAGDVLPAVLEPEDVLPAVVEPVVAVPEVVPVVAVPAAGDAPSVASGLARYEVFTGSTIPVAEASRHELINGIEEIVAVEGPILGDRIHSVYVRASGGQKVGSQLAKALNSALVSAVRQGVLEKDGSRPATYRLPEQPPARVRELGPRGLGDVPPAELAALLVEAGTERGWDDDEKLFRALLDRLGLKRLTGNVRKVLESSLLLARETSRR